VVLFGIAAVPNLCFSEEAESRTLDHLGSSSERIGAEENGRPEDPFEGGHQALVLLSSFVHVERFQHFGRSSEANCLALLAHRKRGQINRHDSVLTERQTVAGMTRDL
jgi:hypothetical protein